MTYVTQDGIWAAFFHPLPLFHMDFGSAPYVSHATSFPFQPLSTFDCLPPSSILTLIKMLPTQKQTTCLYSALPGYPLPLPTTNGAVPFPCQSPFFAQAQQNPAKAPSFLAQAQTTTFLILNPSLKPVPSISTGLKSETQV